MYVTEYNSPNGREKLNIWDTPGKTEFRSLRTLVYKDVDVIVFVLSLPESDAWPLDVDIWGKELEHFCPGVPIVLAASKADLVEDETIDTKIKWAINKLGAVDWASWWKYDKLKIAEVFMKAIERGHIYRSADNKSSKGCQIV